MKYDFDKIVDRHGSNCIKWDKLQALYGKDIPEDTLALWIADMDFAVAPAIIEALQKRLEHPVLGYSVPADNFYEICVNYIKRHYHWEVEESALTFCPGIVPALNIAVMAFSEPGDKVISLTPVYGPFKSAATGHNREFVEVDLLVDEEGYASIDFKSLEEQIDEKTKILMLCNPHNPTGCVFTEEEQRKLGDLAVKHDLIIVSDEIHADFIYTGYKHLPIGSLDPAFAERVIACYAPSKTFNVAGLSASIIAIPNPELKEAFDTCKGKLRYSANLFGYIGLAAAWEKCDDWLSELMVYLEGNRDYLVEEIIKRVPCIKSYKPESTYLLWLDCRDLMEKKNIADEDLGSYFAKHGLALNKGSSYGDGGKGFMRLNFACSRSLLEKAVDRLEALCR